MKKMYLALAFVVLFFSINCWSQGQRFYVDDISVLTDVNATLVHSYADELVNWNGLSNKREIGCLRYGLLRTGLFKSVITQLRLISPKHYKLLVSAKLRYRDARYTITTVRLRGYDSEVDGEKFSASVRNAQVTDRPIDLLTDLPKIQNALSEAMRQAFRTRQPDDRWLPVLVFRLLRGHNLRLTLTRTLVCGG